MFQLGIQTLPMRYETGESRKAIRLELEVRRLVVVNGFC